jgi:aspartate aminotransferase
MATAKLLDDPATIRAFQATFLPAVKARLDALHAGFTALKAEGLPVDAIAPQGAIYLSARFDLFGRTLRGMALNTNEDIRQLLLQHAGLAIVPFQAFGLKEESGWFRLSVGAVSLPDIAAMMPRLRGLLA